MNPHRVKIGQAVEVGELSSSAQAVGVDYGDALTLLLLLLLWALVELYTRRITGEAQP